jgi:hypothetical protein
MGVSLYAPVKKQWAKTYPHEIIGREAVLPLPGMIDVGRLERVMVEIGWYTVCGPENGGLGWLWKGWRCVRGVRGG